MSGARARPGPILPGLKIRVPTETGSPSGPKREWPLGHRRKGGAHPPISSFGGRPPESSTGGKKRGVSRAPRRGPGAMGSARARPGPILSGLKIRAPTETGSPSGPKREWPLGHRCKDAAARCRSPVGDPRPGRNGGRRAPAMGVASGNAKGGAKRSKNGVARRRPPRRPPRPPLGVGDLSDRGYPAFLTRRNVKLVLVSSTPGFSTNCAI